MKFLSFPGYQSTMGLGNRIFCLIGDIMLAKEFYNMDFSIYWENKNMIHKVLNEESNKKYYWKVKKYKFQELFNTDFEILNEIPKDDYLIIHKSTIKNNNPYISKNPIGIVNGFPILENEIELIKDIKSYQEEFNGTTAFCFDRLPKYFQEKYKEYFNLLKPSKNVLEKIKDYDVNKDTIGVHIRRGDFLHYNIKKYNRTKNTLDKYFEKIEENKKIFLCTDCDKTEKEFIEKYGDNVIIFKTDKKVRDDFDAFCMIILLSKCGTLLLSNYSSFSELAWWFSKCESKVFYIN